MISFFFNKNSGSGKIRGYQIGKYLGAKMNPKDGYENDVCIYVKKRPPENHPKNTYLDIVDCRQRLFWIKRHPNVKVIACSVTSYFFLKRTVKNEIIYIPQHHCNFKREIKMNYGNVKGVVGREWSISEGIESLIPNFVWVKDFKHRQDVIDGYKKIDIQIIWRKIHLQTSKVPSRMVNQMFLKNPLKIINAMSFGIPTIAYPEICNEEVKDFYFKADKIEDLFKPIKYDRERLIDKAEEYHIDNVSKLYKQLDN